MLVSKTVVLHMDDAMRLPMVRNIGTSRIIWVKLHIRLTVGGSCCLFWTTLASFKQDLTAHLSQWG